MLLHFNFLHSTIQKLQIQQLLLSSFESQSVIEVVDLTENSQSTKLASGTRAIRCTLSQTISVRKHLLKEGHL